MKRVIYLDNNATTPVDPRVVDDMVGVLRSNFGNPASRSHRIGWYASELVEIARERVAKLLGGTPEEIVFTSGATESINLAITGTFLGVRSKGDSSPHLVTFATEHSATLDAVRSISSDGARATLLPVNADGSLDETALQAALSSGAALVSVMAVNNELGIVHDVEKVSRLAKRHGALVHCDAVQAIGKMAFNAPQSGADFVSISAHKFYGPKGIGALWIRSGSPLPHPLMHGGGHERGLRPGTLNVPGIVGLGRAAALALEELATNVAHLERITEIAVRELLRAIPDIRILTNRANAVPGTLSVAIPRLTSDRLLAKLATKVALSASSACTSLEAKPSHVIAALGLDEDTTRGAFRISCGRFTEEADVVEAVRYVADAARALRGVP